MATKIKNSLEVIKHQQNSIFFITVYVVFMLVNIFMSFFSKYGDCVAYTQWSVNIWDALFSGRIREYFLVSAEKLRGYYCGNAYGVLYLLPWAIWNFPLWLSRIILNKDTVATTLCILWSKMFLILCAHVMAFYCSKIVFFFTKDEKLSLPSFLNALCCCTMFVSIAYFGQDEIVYMSVFLAAVYYVLQDNKKLGYFLLGTTVMLCNLMLIPVLAVLFIKEKNLLKILALVVCFVLPEKIASSFCGIGQLSEIAKNYTVAGSYHLRDYFDWFFRRSMFQFSDYSVSLFAIIVVVIFLLSYIYKTKDSEQENYMTILMPAISLLAMTIFSWLHAYRWFIYFPLCSILVFINGKKDGNLKTGIVILTVLDFFKMLVMLPFDYVLRQGAFSFGPVTSIWKQNNYQADFYSLFQGVIGDNFSVIYQILFSSCFIGCVVLLLIYIFKGHLFSDIHVSKPVVSAAFTMQPLVLLFTVLFLPVIINIRLFNINPNSALSAPINCENTISQSYKSSSLTRLRFIKIRPVTWNRKYPENLKLTISLVDAESVESILEKEIDANSLSDNQEMKVPFNVKLQKNHNYLFKFMGGGAEESENLFVLTDSKNLISCIVATRF